MNDNHGIIEDTVSTLYCAGCSGHGNTAVRQTHESGETVKTVENSHHTDFDHAGGQNHQRVRLNGKRQRKALPFLFTARRGVKSNQSITSMFSA